MTAANLSRRTFLRGAGVALALPLLDAMAAGAGERRRLVAVCTALGLHAPYLFPAETGPDYRLTAYLEPLAEFRRDFTIFSGLSHPDVDGGHASEASYLTAAPHPGRPTFRNRVSLDQWAAEQLGGDTRFASLTLTTGQGSLSWTRAGVQVPAEVFPSRVFAKLFLDGTKEQVRTQVRRLQDGQSILDVVHGRARRLHQDVGAGDRQKLDEYFTAVRDLEQRLTKAEEWTRRPRPRVEAKPPRDLADRGDIIGRTRLMYDLVHLALQTDSTRLVTLHVAGTNLVPPIRGVTFDHHNLSHHGKDPEKIEQLRRIELEQMKALAELLRKLKTTQEDGASLLDRTMVLFGSNLGNAASHDTRNLPILLAGGGFRHGQHLAFDTSRNVPLCNLFVAMLRRLGLETDAFGSSSGTVRGLEMV